MALEKIFNRGIASGDGFCNRTKELAQLINNIKKLNHTLLISPRRYGKTSLALRAIEGSNLPYGYIDLFMKCNVESVLREFYEGVGTLIAKVLRPSAKTVRAIEGFLKNIKVSLSLGKVGLEFSLMPTENNMRASFKQLLLGVDELLAKNNKRAVIFVDEMQSIAESELFGEVEAALRFVAQKTRNISFIFSGSSRHLLSTIFEDRNRPFYKLCHKMSLERITEEHYNSFINKFSRREWGKNFDDDVLNVIYECTEFHPYYINILCDHLFNLKKMPTKQDVREIWEIVCLEEQGSIARDIEFLTTKQKNLLSEISKDIMLKEPTAKDFVHRVNMTPRGISLGLKVLLRYDLIEKTSAGVFRIVDPVLAYWLKS